MKWNHNIAVTTNGTDLLLEGLDKATVRLRGSSCTVLGGTVFSNSFLCILEKNVKEVIAVTVQDFPKSGSHIETSFLIGIDWKDGQPFVDPKRNFVSFNDNNHVAISGDGLDALINGEIYTSRTDKQGDYIVDADTICKYAALKISADAVKSVATEIEKEKTLVNDLRKELQETKITVNNIINDQTDRIDELNSTLANVAHDRSEWRTAAKKLSKTCENRWTTKIFGIPADISVDLANIKGLTKVISD